MINHTTDSNLPFRLEGDLPLTFLPLSDSPTDRSLDTLCGWLNANEDWVREHLTRHGAFRFRGFAVEGPEDFERVARAIDDELGNDYLGTSPRDAVTDYVFNASELPDFFPIPQHCEMSFCAKPPRRVFFCCLDEPAEGGGETPLCDFRKVWHELPDALRKRFEDGGIRIVRNYAATGGERDDDPTMLKPWTEMFLTSSTRGVVPIVNVAGTTIGQGQPGPITQRLARAVQGEITRIARPAWPPDTLETH